MARKFNELTRDWSPERKARVDARVAETIKEMKLMRKEQATRKNP